MHVPPTRYCAAGHVKPLIAAAAIALLINDTLVFLAITWRLSCNSYACPTFKHVIRVFAFGDYLPALSKAMLQDGQAYYLLVPP